MEPHEKHSNVQSWFYAAKDKIENCITNQFWRKHILFECGFWKFMHSIDDSLRELLLNVFKKCFLCFIFSNRILSYLTLENNDFSCNEKQVASFCSKHSSLWILWHPYENTWVIFGLCITEKQFFIYLSQRKNICFSCGYILYCSCIGIHILYSNDYKLKSYVERLVHFYALNLN